MQRDLRLTSGRRGEHDGGVFDFLRQQAFVRRKWGRVAGLTLTEYGVLEAIATVPGSMPSQIAETLGLPRNIVSGATSTLAETGLIRRLGHGSDRRRARLFLTEEGHHARVKCAQRWAELLAEWRATDEG